MEWVAQCAIYTCRVYGQKETIKFKEKEIPATLLEQYSATLLHDNQVGGQISFKKTKKKKRKIITIHNLKLNLSHALLPTGKTKALYVW